MTEDAETYAPPNDLHAEQCVLGGMLLSPDAIADATDILTVDDFYRPNHATIYTAICHLYGTGEPADAVTLANHLAQTGDLGRIGGGPYIHDLISTVPTAANVGYYAKIVAEKAGYRRLLYVRDRITNLVASGMPLADAQDTIGQALYEATTRSRDGGVVRLRDLLQPTITEIQAAAERHGLQGSPTGLVDLDRLTHGMAPGHLWIVAGRPGMGKSVCAVDFARSVALGHKRPVVFFTLEMTHTELMLRITAAEARVELQRLHNGGLTEQDWDRINTCYDHVKDAPLFMGDRADTTLMQIRSTARRIAMREGDLGLVVVDYLQLMPTIPTGRRDTTREREVADLSRGLKLLAKELKVPVVALSQLNRGVEARHDKRPNLSDLRESGALEQDSDVIVLLYRDDYYDKESPRAGEVDLIVEKNRHGHTDTVTVAAQLNFSRFVDMAVDGF